MTALLVRNPEIAARLAPLGSVRRNPSPLPARVRDEVGELMAEGAVDLFRAMRSEQRIERDEVVAVISAPRRGAESRAPLDAHGAREGARPSACSISRACASSCSSRPPRGLAGVRGAIGGVLAARAGAQRRRREIRAA
jgi:hypothetical protein